VRELGATTLLFASILLLEWRCWRCGGCRGFSAALAQAPAQRPSGGDAAQREAPIGGGVLDGMLHTLRSPYLLNVCLFMLLFTVTSTFLYFQQASIARDYFPDRAARTAFFAQVDLIVNLLTLAMQILLTARLLKGVGVALTLAALPALSAIGFAALAAAPVIAVLVSFQVLRRAANFALARPTRELLFTVVSREDKYKSKTFIDTVVYRTGDQVGSWSYLGLTALGLGVAGVAAVAVPLGLLWVASSLWLGRRFREPRRSGCAPKRSRRAPPGAQRPSSRSKKPRTRFTARSMASPTASSGLAQGASRPGPILG